MLVDPRLCSADDFGGKIGIGYLKDSHPSTEPFGIERVDGKCPVATLRTTEAARKPRTGAAGSVGERGVDDLHEFGVAGRKRHGVGF